jgi:hypothetical protein
MKLTLQKNLVKKKSTIITSNFGSDIFCVSNVFSLKFGLDAFDILHI